MSKPKSIIENPYRVLGVYANSPRKDISANVNKANAFIKVDKAVSFPLDQLPSLPTVTRTAEVMADAVSHLAVADEQVRYGQFWFIKLSNVDDVAFNHLLAGDADKALSIWQTRDDISSLQNRMVLAFIHGDNTAAMSLAVSLYRKYGDKYRETVFPSLTISLSGEELLNGFADALCDECGASEVARWTTDAQLKKYIGGKQTGPLVSLITEAVNEAKSTPATDAAANLAAGERLLRVTAEAFATLKSILPKSDPQLVMIADKLGLAVLDCGIRYYNNSDDDDAAFKAQKIQQKARGIVMGSLAIGRCEDNLKTLREIIATLPPRRVASLDRQIKSALSLFVKQPDEMVYSMQLLDTTVPLLNQMGTALGYDNEYYIKVSTLIGQNAMANVIAVINKSLNWINKVGMQKFNGTGVSQEEFLNQLNEAMAIASRVEPLAKTPEFQDKFSSDKNALAGMLNDVVGASYKTTGGDSDGLPSGCLWAIGGALMLFLKMILSN